ATSDTATKQIAVTRWIMDLPRRHCALRRDFGQRVSLPEGRLRHRTIMAVEQHLRITASALKNWFLAQAQDSLAVGLLWLIGLLIIGVPLAPLWAVLATFLQFIPHLGP